MRSTIILVLALSLAACGGESASGSDPKSVSSATAAAMSFEKSPDSGKVDRVGPDDGALKPDGINDLCFAATVDGPVSAMFLVTVDEQGKPNGDFQADTLVGSSTSPSELGAKAGKGTSGLGVAEGGTMLNAADGSLSELGAGPHKVTVYVAPAATLRSGTKVRLYVQRPDKSLVASGTVTN